MWGPGFDHYHCKKEKSKAPCLFWLCWRAGSFSHDCVPLSATWVLYCHGVRDSQWETGEAETILDNSGVLSCLIVRIYCEDITVISRMFPYTLTYAAIMLLRIYPPLSCPQRLGSRPLTCCLAIPGPCGRECPREEQSQEGYSPFVPSELGGWLPGSGPELPLGSPTSWARRGLARSNSSWWAGFLQRKEKSSVIGRTLTSGPDGFPINSPSIPNLL